MEIMEVKKQLGRGYDLLYSGRLGEAAALAEELARLADSRMMTEAESGTGTFSFSEYVEGSIYGLLMAEEEADWKTRTFRIMQSTCSSGRYTPVRRNLRRRGPFSKMQ